VSHSRLLKMCDGKVILTIEYEQLVGVRSHVRQGRAPQDLAPPIRIK
jgi:hypothetical protein